MFRFTPAAIALVGLLTVVAHGHAQPLPLVVQKLTQPADALCRAAKGKPITLKELGQLVAKHHGVKVELDEAAFRQAAPEVEFPTLKVTLPIKPGLRLATVLHYILENDLPVQGTFKLTKDGIVIGPGATQVVQDEFKDGPVGKRLDATLMASKTDAQESIAAVLAKVEKATGLPILLANRKFIDAGQLEFADQKVKVPRQTKVPAAKFLRDLLDQVDANFLVKPDHILVVPKEKAKK